MNLRKRLAPTLLALAALGLMAAGAGIAMNLPTKPPLVATVDLERLFNGLDVQKTEDTRLQAVAKVHEDKIESLRAEVENFQSELENFEPSSEAWLSTNQKAENAVSSFLAYEQFARLKVEAELAKSTRTIYTNIRTTISKFCAAQNPPIDMVIVDDSIPAFEPADSAGTRQQISARRILYANSAYDITDAVLNRMNTP